MGKANKGEWSEFYAFLKILYDQKLFAADKNLSIIPDKFFIFHKLIREEYVGEKITYDLNYADKKVRILNKFGAEIDIIDISSFGGKTRSIFEKINADHKGTFEVPEARELMSVLHCEKVKASGTRKEDLIGVIDDRITPTPVELGFSIKSMIGGLSTLLNAGNTTNFIFKINGFKGDFNQINSIEGKSKIRDRIKAISNNGGQFSFINTVSPIFSKNLRKIDTIFPQIMALMVFDFFCGKGTTILELSELLCQSKELEGFDFSIDDFRYKIKNFLDSIALGMVPSKEWDGNLIAQGGYIVVKDNGDVICYHLYNRDEFRTYLFENTKLETASSTRHNFGKIYKEGDELFFNLNLQIRFNN